MADGRWPMGHAISHSDGTKLFFFFFLPTFIARGKRRFKLNFWSQKDWIMSLKHATLGSEYGSKPVLVESSI